MRALSSGYNLNWFKACSSHSHVRHSLAQFQVPVRLYHILPTFSYSNRRTYYKCDFLTSKDPSIFNCFNKTSALSGYNKIKIKENILREKLLRFGITNVTYMPVVYFFHVSMPCTLRRLHPIAMQ